MTLRRRFIAILVLFSVSLTALGGFLAWSVTSDALEAELDEKLLWVAGAAADAGLQATVLMSFEPGQEDLQNWRGYQARLQFLRGSYVDLAHVFKRDGTAIVTHAPADSIPIGAPLSWLLPFDDAVQQAWSAGQSTTTLFTGNDGRSYKYGFVRIEDSDAMLAVLMPADYMEPLAAFRRRIILGSFGAVGLAALIAWWLAANIVRPLERLSRAALSIQRGRMDTRIAVGRGDEVGRLSRAMERMRLGIQHRDEQLRLMLSQVAHEIRNPLGGLELFASAAQDTEDQEERARLLGRVRSEVRALNEIIDEFLTFARPHRTELRRHDVRGPIGEAAELVEAETQRSGRTLDVDLPQGPLMVEADPYQVKRILLNLMRNAAQAGEAVSVAVRPNGDEVRISVRDNGPGVAPELADRIFEPFVSDKERGAGLGLAIVKGLVEANRGRVVLVRDRQENPGEGAEFRVYLKTARAPDDALEA